MKKKKILVTGGSNGIGKAICDLAVSRGYEVYNFDLLNGDDVTRPIKLKITPDILVNCAGITAKGSVRDDYTYDQTVDVMAVNFFGALNMTMTAVRKMKKGAIINICSKSAYKPMKNRLAYCASKGALFSLTKQLALDLAPNIRVNSISPGIIDTDMKNSVVSGLKRIENLLKRKGLPEEVARLVLDVAENEYITGQDFTIDGGYSIL